eukprot:m.240608 g.240608  ORF g.240608 m.240608 type:complete len:454 (+) comp13697_c0_seq1:105-1466(+)
MAAKSGFFDNVMLKVFGPKKPEHYADDGNMDSTVEVHDQSRNPYTELLLLQGHENIVRHIVVLDETRVVTSGDDGKIIIWNATDGSRVVSKLHHKLPISAMIAWTLKLDQTVIVTAAVDHSVNVWDSFSANLVNTLQDIHSSAKCLTVLEGFVTDLDSLLCIGGKDISICDVALERVSQFVRDEQDEEIRTIIPYAKLGRLFAATNSTDLHVFQVKKEDSGVVISHVQVIRTNHLDNVRCLVPVSDTVFASGSLDGSIDMFMSHSLRPVRFAQHREKFEMEMAHARMASFCINHMVVIEHYLFAAIGRGFAVWDVNNEGFLLCDIRTAHQTTINMIALLKKGVSFATCANDGSIRLWSFQDHLNHDDVLYHPRKATDIGLDAVFSPKKRRDSYVLPTCIGELAAHSDAVTALALTPSNQLVSCGADKLVIVWKLGDYEKTIRAREAASQLSNI